MIDDDHCDLPTAPVRFVCPGAVDGEAHETVPVFRRCPRCRRFALAGFECDTCGYDDIDRADGLSGHGPDRCELRR